MAPYPNAISGLPEGGMLFLEVIKHGAKLEGTVANLERGAFSGPAYYIYGETTLRSIFLKA